MQTKKATRSRSFVLPAASTGHTLSAARGTVAYIGKPAMLVVRRSPHPFQRRLQGYRRSRNTRLCFDPKGKYLAVVSTSGFWIADLQAKIVRRLDVAPYNGVVLAVLLSTEARLLTVLGRSRDGKGLLSTYRLR